MTQDEFYHTVETAPEEELQQKFVIIPCEELNSTFYQERASDRRQLPMWVSVFKLSTNEYGLREVRKVHGFILEHRPFYLVTPNERRFFRNGEELHNTWVGDYGFMPLIGQLVPDGWSDWAPKAILGRKIGVTEDRIMFIRNPSGVTIGAREMTADEVAEFERLAALNRRKLEIRKRIEMMRRTRRERERKERREREEREFNERVPRLMRALEESAERIYPGFSEVTLDNNGLITVKIHFPEIDMTNSQGAKHKIFDLFVSLTINSQGRVQEPSLKGDRTTFNYAEFVSTFVHSHLPGGAVRFTEHFCLNGNNLQTLLTDLRKDSFFDDSERWIRTFEGILFQLESYVSWESLEGSCYRKIKDISIKRDQGHIDIPGEVRRMIRKVDPSDTPPLIYVKGVGFQLSANSEAFEDWLVKYATLKQFKNDRGEYYNEDGTGNIPKENFIVPESRPVTFKGKVFQRTVRVDFYHEKQEEKKKYCHGQIKGAFVQWANRRLQRAFAERNLRTIFRDVLARNKKEANAYSIAGKGKTKAQSASLLEAFTPVSNV